MKRLVVNVANCALLMLVLLGIPAICGVQFGRWQLSSVPTAQWLRFWTLVLAAAGNIGAARFLVKGRKDREACWLWMAVFALLAGGEFAFERGYMSFDWLKRGLLWVTNRV